MDYRVKWYGDNVGLSPEAEKYVEDSMYELIPLLVDKVDNTAEQGFSKEDVINAQGLILHNMAKHAMTILIRFGGVDKERAMNVLYKIVETELERRKDKQP